MGFRNCKGVVGAISDRAFCTAQIRLMLALFAHARCQAARGDSLDKFYDRSVGVPRSNLRVQFDAAVR
jgi:hypothetical protein